MRLLGPVDVVVDGVARPVAGLRRAGVLAALALHPGQFLGPDRLIDMVWGDTAPQGALATLRSHVSYLRRLLGQRAAIAYQPAGYQLVIGEQDTDVLVAEHLIHQATTAADPQQRERLLRDAVALWRGQPLAELAGLAWFSTAARRLDDLQRHARELLIDAQLALGEHARLIPELETLSREHPHHEPTHRQLILALYRAGRQGEALKAYQRLRHVLDDDLGISPSRALRELETAILRQDPALNLPAAAAPAIPAQARPRSAAPAQLPLSVAAFAGRRREIARLDGLLAGGQGAVMLAALSGPPGVGKTSLALRWAHRVASRFPDGQLYVNMRGFDPDHPPVDPATAIRTFLAAFGGRAAELPTDLDALAAHYRGVVDGRRMLLVLDNAVDADQVRPLLPGAAGCAVVVTSRNELPALVAPDGTAALRLDVLTDEEAWELLELRLGTERIAREPAAVSALISRCGHLPLALAVAAARVRARPGAALAVETEQLRTAAGGLDDLDGGDQRSSVRAVFSWSYRALDGATARLFRLLALHPGPSTTEPAAASLAGIGLAAVRPLLTALLRANLLTENTPGRYAVHDLLRAYGAELAADVDPERDRQRAKQRLLEHFARTATAAVMLLDPARPAVPASPTPPDVTVVPPADPPAARAWFAAEDATLQAAVAIATSGDTDRQAWQLAWAMTTYLDWIGHWQDLIRTQLAIMPALDRLRDLPAKANAHRDIGRTYAQLGRYGDAATHLHSALELYRTLADPTGQGRTYHSLGWMHQAQGDYRAALAHAEQALALFQEAGNTLWQARELDATGWLYVKLGEPAPALERCRRALPLLRDLQDRHGEAGTLDTMGIAHHQLGEDDQAIRYLHQALQIYTELGDGYSQATVRLNIGDCHAAQGRREAALSCWRRGLDDLRTLDQAGTERLRAQLSDRCRAVDDAVVDPSC